MAVISWTGAAAGPAGGIPPDKAGQEIVPVGGKATGIAEPNPREQEYLTLPYNDAIAGDLLNRTIAPTPL